MSQNYKSKNRRSGSGSSTEGGAKRSFRGSGGRSQFKGRGRNSFGGGRGRRRSGGGGRRGYSQSKINHERYISKAIEVEQQESMYIEEVTFSDFDLAEVVLKNITQKGYIHPTKIQNQAIPEILNGKDILGMASTGSGKTAAFLLPMITKAIRNRNEKCLIVVPTRELANQIQQELLSFSRGSDIREVVIIGGSSFKTQIRLLNRNPQFVIATPGRLIDLYKSKKLNLKDFNNVVLDEVDQMLDMGFVKDIEYIISNLSNNRQSLFFSATMNDKAKKLAESISKTPLVIQIEKQNAASNVDQNIVRYKVVEDKVTILHDILIADNCDKALVFSKTRRGADKLNRELEQRGFRSGVIHGLKSMGHRNKTIAMFRKDTIDVLVATDVAARGIDINDISHIINYDEPATMEDYIHRIGRTGRIGKKGTALTFVK